MKALSIVSATIEEVDDESLADDVDAFLNCCLRKSDLLFRCAPSRWVIVLPDSASPVADRVDWIEQQRHAANRNRPGGLLPPLDLLVHGTWNTANEQQAIVDCIRQATESVLDNLAPAGT